VGIVTDRDIVLRGEMLCEDPGEAQIESIMTSDIVTIRKDTGIFEAIQVMKSAGVRRMPIVDGAGRLVALLTIDDIIRLLARELGDIARIIGMGSPDI
jgi:CBS domain-containing protein